MSTGTVIVQDSLRQIGAHSLVAPAPAETLDIGFNMLNAMLHLWLTQNIALGVSPLQVIGDELHEPADSRNAITSNLAVVLAPNFDNGGNKVSQILLANAVNSFQIIKNAYMTLTVPDKVVSATLPRGQGSRLYFTDAVFFGGGATLNDTSNE